MVTLFGIPLIGTLFIPTLLGFLTFYIIWSLSTRKKDADCTVEQILPSDSALTVNNIGSKPKRKVFGNRADSVSIGQDDNSYSKGDSNSLPQVKLHYTQNAKRKVFGSKVGELTSLSLQLENNLAKKNTRKKRCKGKSRCCSKKKGPSKVLEGTIEIVKVFFGTQTGKSKTFSTKLGRCCEQIGLSVELVDLASFDPEERLLEETSGKSLCVFILPTHTDGKPPESAAWFCKWLEEASNDFRVERELFKGMKFAVFGLGNSQYKDHFNQVGKQVDRWLQDLHAARFIKLGVGDEDTSASKRGSIEADFQDWIDQLWMRVDRFRTACQCDGSEQEKAESSCDSSSEGCDSDGNSSGQDSHGTGVIDLEELGAFSSSFRAAREKEVEENSPREMVTAALRDSLTRQGYRIVGTHSGVKLCRWTKSMLRGRGGCYKHSFYGIESHRCMETTPSLACANKCVFCWRHHSNPVGTEWRWKMDPPDKILKDSLENHYNMIKQFKGVPGVLPERFAEGMDVKHCALSLVGEPIMYPEISNFVLLLHEHGISTFLVTNAQFPKALRDMGPVTQLYVSVDASTKSSLRKIDRPLFKDFWERFIDSLKALSEKGQRTVYRLTLVKSWNVDEIMDYSKLVEIGKPDFIEVKGVTYCGTSKASNLTMENVPWHEEVITFVKKLGDLLPDYEIASEHEHSNCVLLAHRKFKVNGEWWTWIDYNKFHELVQRYYSTDGASTFTAEDYMFKTPPWAVFGASERGFDPVEKRWHRKRLPGKDISGC
ncbi:S-adenosyl-L-methionine-dependent tRNA 4-demethylwyosine synthase-like [Zootermopsis nevadensis]|uniref:S-adenosyl-L-methionine-dependent tRNA 4-demethylwyosine synthase TYW1 n=1 Tax=Zootermopsis nevadensis TaxID=136037 RepID=A0A067QHA3_ZOONE|nr:S-adenosyl-L-methionine-dependent tRNA 4-demethylwyosine synthase-like [Zootermopsis nevadensis]KDQ97265.1 TRNA wybutosine-synthesizing protein 1-like protein [Zootermopsis nevadensis]